jgi:hypothetical protein
MWNSICGRYPRFDVSFFILEDMPSRVVRHGVENDRLRNAGHTSQPTATAEISAA